MSEPLVSIDFLVGDTKVDAGHAAITQAAAEFQRLVDAKAPRGDIVSSFARLRDLIVHHFPSEELLLRRLEADPANADHVRRHRAHHRTLADSFTYAFDKIAATKATEPLPAIVTLIPKKYIDEMLSVDMEMAELLRTVNNDR